MTAASLFLYGTAVCAVFGIVVLPVLMRQPTAFVSPYGKADVRKRAAAAIVDGLLVATCFVPFQTRDALLFIAAGVVYLLFRDALFIPGQSIGKFFFALRVISLDDGRPCGRLDSVKRNFILVVPGLNLVAAVLETRAIVRDTQGQRLGDTLANTQVVEGLGVRELATSLQRDLIEASANRRGREQPVEVK